MKTAILNANIVIPQKEEILNDSSMVIENGLISRIDKGTKYRYDYSMNIVIDAKGGYLIPGIINSHSHGFTLGPLLPTALDPLPFEQIIQNLNRHLLQGTTTLLSADGFSTMQEVETINKLHPMKIKASTSHTPLNIKAAEIAQGFGLNDFHKQLDVKQMIDSGAISIGEIGCGYTLGGGGVSYYSIPTAIEKITGKRITTQQAEKLKISVLGRYMDPSDTDKEKVKIALEEAGLAELLTIEEAIDTMMKVVYAPVEIARDGVREAAELALKYDIPLSVHNSAPSKEVILEVAKRLGNRLVAGHSNHTSFTEKEKVEFAKELKKYGTIIDISTGDYYGARQLINEDMAESTMKMIEEGIGDVISTDFMGGHWDSILRIIEEVVSRGHISLPKAVAMASSNVVKAVPNIAPNGGMIEVGKIADLVIIEKEKISKVNHVLINGIPVVENGKIKFPNPNWFLS